MPDRLLYANVKSAGEIIACVNRKIESVQLGYGYNESQQEIEPGQTRPQKQ